MLQSLLRRSHRARSRRLRLGSYRRPHPPPPTHALAPPSACCGTLTRIVPRQDSVRPSAVELNLVTLGPPQFDWAFIRQRLHRYERDKEKVPWWKWWGRVQVQVESRLGGQIKAAREQQEKGETAFCDVPAYSELVKLDPFDDGVIDAEAEEAKKLSDMSVRWMGQVAKMSNWREAYSTTITPDLFGSSECRATLLMLYRRISLLILDILEREKYDVSDYRDERGHLTISTEKVDQMVIGENVSIERGRVAKRKGSQSSGGEGDKDSA